MRIGLSQDTALPHLGINPKDASSYPKDNFLIMLFATLLIAKNGNNERKPKMSFNKRNPKRMYVYKIVSYIDVKQKNMKFAGK